jgi:multiple sugar transport system substrate-binding protein
VGCRYSKIQTAIAGGTTPDIAMMGSTWMADFADAFQTVPTDLDTAARSPAPSRRPRWAIG